jgi:TonB family protein
MKGQWFTRLSPNSELCSIFTLPLAPAVHFLLPELYGGTGVAHAFSISSFRGIGRLIAIAAILALAAPLHAQESTASDAAKRKVKARVAAEYPQLARQMGVSGKVKVEVTITADGKVSATKIVGGSPVLVSAAVDAVKKWKFEPGPKDTVEIIEFEFKDPAS